MTMGISDIKRYCERRKADLERDFTMYRDHAVDLRDYFMPFSGRDLSNDSSSQETDGGKKMSKIYDNTPMEAVNAVAAGMYSGMTSPAQQWFTLRLPDPSINDLYSVREWVDDVETRMRAVFSGSNIYTAFRHCFMELNTYGTWACAVLDDDRDVIRAEYYTYGEYRLAQNDAKRVDTFFRKFRITVRQAVQWWGLDAVGKSIRLQWENNEKEQYITVFHLVEPNDDSLDLKEAKNFPYRSIYWCQDKQYQMLEATGFHEWPMLTPRWYASGNRVYGDGPAAAALPDAKQLQLMTKDKLILIGKMADPPMVSEGIDMNAIDTMQGGVSVGQQGQSMKPLFEVNPAGLVALQQDIQLCRERINRAMHVDLFRMMMDTDRRQMTAREVSERSAEKLMLLGPVVESLQHELLDPLITRTFGIMLRRGMIPPPPEEIQGMALQIEYVSPLAQAQKMAGINAYERFLSFAGSLAGAMPQVLDVVNGDEFLAGYADGLGLPQKLLNDDKLVAQVRQQRAQAMQQERAVVMEQQAAQGAKLLSETNVGNEQNLLESLLQ